jgi:hypothetical protein
VEMMAKAQVDQLRKMLTGESSPSSFPAQRVCKYSKCRAPACKATGCCKVHTQLAREKYLRTLPRAVQL